MAQEIADSKLIDTWSSSGLIVKPDISKIIEGWQLGEQPPHEYMNWLQNTFGSKLNHILKNGVAKWEPETPYLAGSSVQHSGNVWLCKVDNANSEPTDANSNWKRIITVESLTTVLGGYVALTDFTGTNQSKITNGYQKLPGGLIIQWGVIAPLVPGAGVSVTLPISFPSLCVFRVAQFQIASNSATPLSFATDPGATPLSSFIVRNTGGATSGSSVWLAIGY